MTVPAVRATPYTLVDYFDVVKRRWIFLATILPLSILAAVYLAYTLPPLYRSQATILLEPSSIPEDMVRTTVTTYASEQLELVWRRIFTNENLTNLVETLDPYPDLVDVPANEKARILAADTETERVDPITMEPALESTAFAVSYLNPDPQMARAVTSQLVDMFLDYTRVTRTEQATETHDFLKIRADEARKRLGELDSEIAEFKAEFGDALPDARQRNQQSLDRAERDLDNIELQIVVAQERKRALELQLSQTNPNLFDPAGDWRAELVQAQADLAEARRRYSESHPDVRRLVNVIAQLSARAQESVNATTEPDNPEYIQLANQLNSVDSELRIHQGNAARLRTQLANFERSLAIAPDVELKYSELTRDYEQARAELRDAQADLSEAALAQVLESQQRGIRYSLIRAPSWPSTPDSPNRIGIILLGIVLGGGLAVGLAALVESSDPTVRSARDLSEITDIKPLGAVPRLLNGADKRKRMAAWAAATAISVAAIAFVGSAIS
jgi:protein tyrosine kinase modulator